MPCCCMNDFASLSADFTTPHFSADLPETVQREKNAISVYSVGGDRIVWLWR